MESRIYRKNILYQQIWYKFCCFCLIRDIFILKFNKRTLCWGAVMAMVFFLDSFLGIVIIDSTLRVLQPDDLVKVTTLYIDSVLKWMEQTLEWFMNVPVGLKLNNQLTEFLSMKFIDLLHLWTFFYSVVIAEYLHIVFNCILYAKFLGITILLGIAILFFKFLNFWLIWFYLFCRLVIRLHISALVSLLRLFMGRKWNPLRKRVDSCSYDPQQLLLGTLFFISLLFLLPTTLVFYSLFLVLNTTQYLISSTLRCIIVAVNRLVLTLCKSICYWYSTPDISTLTFKISRPLTDTAGSVPDTRDQSKARSLPVPTVTVSAIWNGTEYSLSNVNSLVDSAAHKKTDVYKLNTLEKLSMNKWFDLNTF